MRLEPAEAQDLIAEIRKVVPGFHDLSDKQLVTLIGHALRETTITLKAIEDRIEEAGVMPGDVAGILLHYGAVTEVLDGLPPTSEQRRLIIAGREIGKVIGSKYGQKIREQLEEQKTKGAS